MSHQIAGVSPVLSHDEPVLAPQGQSVQQALNRLWQQEDKAHGIQSHATTSTTSLAYGDTDSFFALFDTIWEKLLLLSKQLRDIMQFYNQKKQEFGWNLEVNTLSNKYSAVENSYWASTLGGIGGILGGVAGLAGTGLAMGKGGESAAWAMSSTFGSSVGQGMNGLLNLGSSEESYKADRARAMADLQGNGSQSYAKTLDDTLVKAREIMQQMMELGKRLVEILTQVLSALSR